MRPNAYSGRVPYFDLIHDLVWRYGPHGYITVYPFHLLVLLGAGFGLRYEWRTWREHR